MRQVDQIDQYYKVNVEPDLMIFYIGQFDQPALHFQDPSLTSAEFRYANSPLRAI